MKILAYLRYLIFLLSQVQARDNARSLEELIRETQEIYEGLIPHRIDANSVMTGVNFVQGERLRLAFFHTLSTADRSQINEKDFKSIHKPLLIGKVRGNKRFQTILQKGGEIEYSFVDKNRFEIACIRLSQATLDGTEVEVVYRDVEAMIEPFKREAILLARTGESSLSYLGGMPPASAALDWPIFKGRPLAHLACIECGEIPKSRDLDWLPRSGKLLFFYDRVNSPWGYSAKDKGAFAAVYLASSDVPDSSVSAVPPVSLIAEEMLPRSNLSFRSVLLTPPADDPRVQTLGLSKGELVGFDDFDRDLYGDLPQHQIGGYPRPLHGPGMELECQSMTNGLNDSDSSAETLKAAAAEWTLLLQLDTDEDLSWGDSGMLYFWVKREEARQLNFKNIWVILQSC